MKILRGTCLDVFGYLPERKEERQTLQDFRALFMEVAGRLNHDNYQTAVELAKLPLQIRGYGHIKSGNLNKVLRRKEVLMRQFNGELIPLTVKTNIAA